MTLKTNESKSIARAVIVGCGLFSALALFVAYRIYASFKETGVPVRSGGRIVATIDPTLPVLVFSAASVLVAFVIARRAWRLAHPLLKSGASEL